jgi:hypothetical protein
MAVISFLMRNGHSNLHVKGTEMQRQSTGTLGDGDVGATINDEVCSATDDPAEFTRFSVCFRLLYHCFLFVAAFLTSNPVHSALPGARREG